MASNQNIVIRLMADTASFETKMAAAGKTASSIGTSMEASGRKSALITSGLTAAGLAVAAFGVASVKMAADFDQQMSTVQANSGATSAELSQLRQAALDAGASTVYTASESAGAINDLAKAGMSVSDILSGGLTCFAITKLTGMDAALTAGMLSGALTSTPGFAAAKAAAGEVRESLVAVGNGVAYPFGVIGVVLFVQLMPKILRADMDAERKKLVGNEAAKVTEKEKTGKALFSFEPFGLLPVCLGILGGILLGTITIPLPGGSSFSLGNTGGALIVALILGHFGRIGRLNMQVPTTTSKLLRELGLVLFLAGSGVEGGKQFVAILKEQGPILFVYGALMTMVPMLIGYFFAAKVLKLSLLNNLGSITGGMTSTPALGTLISSAGTDDVAAAYAATYPMALAAIILVCQLVILLG